MLVEMRHAPDPRLLLEVALVQLTHEAAASDPGALMDRLDRLEQAVAQGAVAAPPDPAPVDPTTGRAQLGGRARRDPTDGAPRPVAPVASAPVTTAPAAPSAPAAPPPAATVSAAHRAAEIWSTEIVPTLKPFVRSIYSVPRLLGVRDGALTLGAPNDAHRSKCEQHRPEVEAAAAGVAGGPVPIALVVESGGTHPEDHGDDAPQPRANATVVPLHPAGPPPADDEIDIHDLVDAPPDSVVTPIDRLTQAFPGSTLMPERH
jgi:DNA polymerase-3 subunit gamma/tau